MSKPIQMPSQRGLPLGSPPQPKLPTRPASPDTAPIFDDDDGHLITFAPTGAGKGVSSIIPALLNWDGPAIVIDPKGENYAVTTRRRLQMGQRVALLDPFKVTGSRILDTFNPLDLVAGPDAVDDAAAVAKLITRGGVFPTDPFWDERAETLITGLILHVLRYPDDERTLAEVRALIEAQGHGAVMLAHEMRHTKGSSTEIISAANILTLPSERTRSSITTTASSHLTFLRSGPVQNATSQSTIALDEIIGGLPVTIFLVLPPDKLISHGKLLRLWLGVFMAALSRRRHRPHRPTLLLIDEAAQLGPLDELRTAVTLMRGYGVRCWSFWQDLSQLKRTYPFDWQSLVNNCAVQQYFGLSMPQAASEVEAYVGGALPRPLSQVADNEALLIRRGHRAQVVRRPNYLADPMFKGQFAPNPFYEPLAERPLLKVLRPPKPTPKNVLTFPSRSGR